MKTFFLLIMACAVCFTSCKKKVDKLAYNDPKIEGRWKMILVIDNGTGSTDTKPAAYTSDVELELHYTGTDGRGSMSGKTINNTFGAGSFQTDINLNFYAGAFTITAAAEEPWGNFFVQNIQSSIAYSFDPGGLLSIRTTVKILKFQKI